MYEEAMIGTFSYGAIFGEGGGGRGAMAPPSIAICQLVFTNSEVIFYSKRPPELSNQKSSLMKQFAAVNMGKAGSDDWKYLKSVMNPNVDYTQKIASEDILKQSDFHGSPYNSIKRVRMYNVKASINPLDLRDPSDADDVVVSFEFNWKRLFQSVKVHITRSSVDMVKELIQKTPIAPSLVIEL